MPNASAAMRVRHSRHIVIPWWLMWLVTHSSWQDIQNDEDLTYSFVADLMRVFPRLEEITVAITQVDVSPETWSTGNFLSVHAS